MEVKQLCCVVDVFDGGVWVVDEVCIGCFVIVVWCGEQVWVYVNCCLYFLVLFDFVLGNVLCYWLQVLMCVYYSVLFWFDDGVCIDGFCMGVGLEIVVVEVDVFVWIVFWGV